MCIFFIWSYDLDRCNGSVGKTTTKAMIALALEGSKHKVYQSPGNWNNQVGVGLSLIGIPGDAGIAVLEMGMSGKGENFGACKNG